jgi:hypothetical protein
LNIRKKKAKPVLFLVLAIFCICDLLIAYQIPYVHDRLAWRIQVAEGYLREFASPHTALVSTADPRLATLAYSTWMARQTPPGPAPRTLPAARPSLSFTETPIPVSTKPILPPMAMLHLSHHEWQKWNNCGPASLAMLLAYWGWHGNQDVTAAYLKPNTDDKNVSPEEMAAFTTSHTGLGAWVRSGGSLDDIRLLIASGFPVIVERGFELPEQNSGWMGHYTLLTKYEDTQQKFTSQDAYRGPDYLWTYEDIQSNWLAFNYVYLVVFPKDREAELHELLGRQADPIANASFALAKAEAEAKTLTGQAQAYAWFNAGTNLTAAGKYDQAVAAFDHARDLGLPWRFLWYQFAPFSAYYSMQRYADVIALAESVIHDTDNVEEAWYWRGMARMAQGDRGSAIADWHTALRKHDGYAPALEQLQKAGASP